MTARKTAAAPAKRSPRRKAATKPTLPPVVDPPPLQQYVEPPPIQRYAEAEVEAVADGPLVDTEWDGYEEPDYRDYREAREGYDRHRATSLRGCLLPVLIAGVFVAMLVIIGILLSDRGVRTPDAPSPVVAPVNSSLAALIEPIRVKLAGDRAKAAIVADAYTGMEAALRGKSGERVTGSRIYEAASIAYLTDVDAKGGVAVGAEIDAAIGAHLGMTKSYIPAATIAAAVAGGSMSMDDIDPGTVDEYGNVSGWEPITFDASHRAKLIEVVAAIADTAEALR